MNTTHFSSLLRRALSQLPLLLAFLAPMWGQILVGQQPSLTSDQLAAKAVLSPSDPLAKFIALRTLAAGQLPAVQIDWPRVYQAVKRDLRPEEYDDLEVAVPLLLGARIADGVVTVVMEDRRALNECAEDIRKLAHRLGASPRTLNRAEEARRLANAGEWGRVYTTLGFLQMNIVQELEAQALIHPGRRAMVYIGGWTQGARFVAAIIDRIGYTPEASSVLRDPRFLEDLRRLLKEARPSLPANGASGAMVAKIDKSLAELHRISDQIKLSGSKMTGQISAEDVRLGDKLATEIINGAIALKKGGAAATSSLGELQSVAATVSVAEEASDGVKEDSTSTATAIGSSESSVLAPPDVPTNGESIAGKILDEEGEVDLPPDELEAPQDGGNSKPAPRSFLVWIWTGGGVMITAVLVFRRRHRN